MYVWIWRKLPGGVAGKLAGCLALFAGALVVLVFAVFPWAEPRLPWNNVNVDQPATNDNPVVQPSTSASSISPVSPTSTVILRATVSTAA